MKTNWNQARPVMLAAGSIGIGVSWIISTVMKKSKKTKEAEKAAEHQIAWQNYIENLKKIQADLDQRIEIGRKALETDDFHEWSKELGE
jgi:hypothetical protein